MTRRGERSLYNFLSRRVWQLFDIFSQFVPLEKSFRATKPNFAFHLMNTSLIVGNGVLLFTILRQTKNKLKKTEESTALDDLDGQNRRFPHCRTGERELCDCETKLVCVRRRSSHSPLCLNFCCLRVGRDFYFCLPQGERRPTSVRLMLCKHRSYCAIYFGTAAIAPPAVRPLQILFLLPYFFLIFFYWGLNVRVTTAKDQKQKTIYQPR